MLKINNNQNKKQGERFQLLNNSNYNGEKKRLRSRYKFKKKNQKKYRYQFITYLRSARKPRPKYKFIGYDSKTTYKSYNPYIGWSKISFGIMPLNLKIKNLLVRRKKLKNLYIQFKKLQKNVNKNRRQNKKSKIKIYLLKKNKNKKKVSKKITRTTQDLLIRRLKAFKQIKKIRKLRKIIKKRTKNRNLNRRNKKNKIKGRKQFKNYRQSLKGRKQLKKKNYRINKKKRIKKNYKRYLQKIQYKFLKRKESHFKVNLRLYFFVKKSMCKKKLIKTAITIIRRKQREQKSKILNLLLLNQKTRLKKQKRIINLPSIKFFKKSSKKKVTKLFLIRKILEYFRILTMKEKKHYNRRHKGALVKTLLNIKSFVQQDVYTSFIKAFIQQKREKKQKGMCKKKINNSMRNVKISRNILELPKYNLNGKQIWNQVYKGIYKTLTTPPSNSKNLIKYYKAQIAILIKNPIQIAIQRQRNSLKLINLIIAKKRKKINNISNSTFKSFFIKHLTNKEKKDLIIDNFIEHNSVAHININNINVTELSVSEATNLIPKVKNMAYKMVSFTEEQKKIQNLLRTYYLKNRLSITGKKLKKINKVQVKKNINNTMSMQFTMLREQWKLLTTLRKATKKQIVYNKKKHYKEKKGIRSLEKKINKKGKKKIRYISKKAFYILKKNLSLATAMHLKNKLTNKLIVKTFQKKPRIYKIGLIALRKLKGDLIASSWKRILLKKIKAPLKFINIKNQRYLAIRKKTKKNNIVFQKTKEIYNRKPKKKINWFKREKKTYSKLKVVKKIAKSKKKSGRKKRGKINMEKRRRLRKVIYFIRPRIINQIGLQAYAKHCNLRGIFFNKFKHPRKQNQRLKKKSFTKAKKNKLIKQLLIKYFNNENQKKIISELKKIKVKNYLKTSKNRYLPTKYVNFIKEFLKTFYTFVTSKQLLKVTRENIILNQIKKTTKIDTTKKKAYLRKLGILNKSIKNRLKKNKKYLKVRRLNALRILTKGTLSGIAKVSSHWKLNRIDRVELERIRKEYIKGAKYIYKGKKLKIKQSKFVSRKILKAHKKAKRKGTKIKKNIIKTSYYYYFKRLRYDRIVFDKLNYKQKTFRMSLKKKIKLSKLLIYLLMRVYVKKHRLKRTNMRLGIKRIKKESKKKQVKKKIKLLGRRLKGLTKKVRRKSKKYIGAIKKTVLIKVLIKLLRSILRSTLGKKKLKIRRRKIKDIIKIFLFPLLINKRQIQKVRLRKKNKIYLVMAQIFLYNMKQIVNSTNYSINFFGLIGSSITAAYVMRRLMERLETCKGSGLWFITKVMKKLMNSKHVVGFKMKFSGRLTGNSMAQQSIMKRGIIGNSNMNVYIDYAQENIVRKHGKCGLKLWIVRNLLTYMPYKYVYTYNFKR